MRVKKEDQELVDHLVDRYRDLVAARYEFDVVRERLNPNPAIGADVVHSLRAYFLDYVFPARERRRRLEQSFEDLSGYLSKPSKMWRLLGNMSAAVFKFGRHFPTALKAGYASLQAFREAKLFETILLRTARENQFDVPLDDAQFQACMRAVPRKDARAFLSAMRSLLEAFSRTVLLEKTMEILAGVVDRMKKYPDVYPADEIEGIELGMEILEQGYGLFSRMDDKLKLSLIELVMANEERFQRELYDEA